MMNHLREPRWEKQDHLVSDFIKYKRLPREKRLPIIIMAKNSEFGGG